jgi:hypothetical protein
MFATNINEARIRYWYLCFSTNKCKDFIKDINYRLTVKRRLEQELLTLLEHLSSLRIFSGVRVARSLVICAMFCRSFFCRSFSPGHGVVLSYFKLRLLITSLISSNFSCKSGDKVVFVLLCDRS